MTRQKQEKFCEDFLKIIEEILDNLFTQKMILQKKGFHLKNP